MAKVSGFWPLLLLLLCTCSGKDSGQPDTGPSQTPLDPFEQNRKLGRGINIGNALEAPSEGEWGIVVEKEWFKVIHDAGFSHVRIPIRWSAHAATSEPFTIDPVFMNRVQEIIGWALEQELMVIINFHHYEELFAQPVQQTPRFKALWTQVAGTLKNLPDDVLFEVLNEPHGNLTAEMWNALLPDLLTIIREDNPGRTVVVGLANYGGLSGLDVLRLPTDSNLIVTPHYYEPFQFTHQGAEWVDGANAWLGTSWTGTVSQKSAVVRDFTAIADWAKLKNVPVHIGEFGAYSRAPMESRVTWTAFVAQTAIEKNMSFAYWEWASGFGIYDKNSRQLNIPLWKALTGRP
jgi:endoglucanase